MFENGELPDKTIDSILTEYGIEKDKYSGTVTGKKKDSVDHLPIGWRRAIIMSHSGFLAAETAKREAKEQAVIDAQAQRTAAIETKRKRKQDSDEKKVKQVYNINP